MTRRATYANGQNLSTTIAASGATFGAITNAVGTAGNLGSALKNVLNGNTSNVNSAIRSLNLPAAGNAVGDIISAVSVFGGDADPEDWRVRLSLPNWLSFRLSPVLKPLIDAGGMIFPYTPTINIKSSANYSPEQITHNNYSFVAYKNSNPGTITINAPMNVEDSTQALYWIAAIHYLRSVTKMFSGSDMKAGNPPPIVFLNGYGNYVFKNIPVVIQSFDCQLNNDCDYISTEVVGSMLSNAGNIIDPLDDIASSLGSINPGISSALGSITGAASQLQSLIDIGAGPTMSGGLAYVPTKSSFTVTLQPVYSRTRIKRFSLDRFVTGGYISNYYGHI